MGNPKVIYKPTLQKDYNDNTVKITYYNREKGKRVSFKIDDNRSHTASKAIQELPRQIANLVSGQKPNINPEQLLDAFCNNIKAGSFMGRGGHIADVNAVVNFAERLIEKYKKPDSEGGNMITPNEQYDMMKQWHQWFGDLY